MTEPKPTFKPTCGTCVFFVGLKDKHGEEGACICMPPSVVGMPARNIANQPVIQWLPAPRPGVRADHFCGQWRGNGQVVPDTAPGVLEN